MLKIVLALLVFCTGCTTTSRGFNRGELRDQMSSIMTITDRDISKALATKAQLPKPFKLGIFFKEPKPTYGLHWYWSGEDKSKILAAVEAAKTKGEISEVFIVSDAITGDSDVKSLRLAAARHGADALLVISGVNDIDSYTNNWGWTYIALVPALFVRASVSDSLFMTRAVMWDVRNEFLYMTAESESVKSQTVPAAFINDRKIALASKTEAISSLGNEITKMIGLLSEKNRNASHQSR
jgi:hypothetical protein